MQGRRCQARRERERERCCFDEVARVVVENPGHIEVVTGSKENTLVTFRPANVLLDNQRLLAGWQNGVTWASKGKLALQVLSTLNTWLTL